MSLLQHLNQHQPQHQHQHPLTSTSKLSSLKILVGGSSSILIGPPHFQCRRQTSLSISPPTSTHINVEVVQFENLGRGVFVCNEPEDLEVASIPFHCPHLRWASLLRNLHLTTFNTNCNNYNSRCKNHLVNWLHVPRTVKGCGLSSKNDAWNGNPQVAQTLRACNIMMTMMVVIMMMMMMLETGEECGTLREISVGKMIR